MQDTIREATLRQYGVPPQKIEPLGGGFYGRAFAVHLDREPYLVVLKLYLFPDLAEKEANQIKTLSQCAVLKMPRIYQVFKKEETGFSYDIVFMEYLKGVIAGNVDASSLPDESRTAICEDIVDNLIAIHRKINAQGFGPLSSGKYFSRWQEYYYPIAEDIAGKASTRITSYVLSMALR